MPLLVRPFKDGYQIISGHRRRAALERAMVSSDAECDVVEMNDEQTYKALMVTNIQAQTLSEIEEAEGIKHMTELFDWTQERVAKEFGKSQNWVNMRLSLLKLEEPVKEMIIARAINPSQARYISTLPTEKQTEIAQQVADEGLTKRETAELVKQINEPEKEVVLVDRGTGEILDSTESNFGLIKESNLLKKEENEDKPIPKPKTERQQFEEQISPSSNYLLLLKDFFREVQPMEWTIQSLMEFNRIDEAIDNIDKVAYMVGNVKKKLLNIRDRPEGSATQDNVIEFRKAE